MTRKPRGDSSIATESLPEAWAQVLAHRAVDGMDLDELVARFTSCGIGPQEVSAVLMDGGDSLYEAAAGGEPGWAEQFGGPLAVALLAAEVSAFASHLNSRASGARSVAVDTLLDDHSAVAVARELGVSRQKVYEIARSGLRGPHLDHVPWRKT
ncbi:hypothetical protein [Brevibacterium linens]|uniref:hypothetical protein n=1 Tax=Brevibacterium linens TaxID=1703 RepID=UPI003515A718